MIEFTSFDGSWVMSLVDGKILFNREKWPEATPDDFAQSVIRLLENATVRMTNWENFKKPEKNERK